MKKLIHPIVVSYWGPPSYTYMNFFTNPLGVTHTVAAVFAMLTGAGVLLLTKGTAAHRKIGYVYVIAMLVLNVTAFSIYNLFGRFGPFHIAAIFSTICIAGGMIPMYQRARISGWLYFHYFFMNWSVIGLYAAFWAETLTRMNQGRQFWPLVLGASLATVTIGAYLVRKYKGRHLPKSSSVQ